jgi:hypothetical protein
MKKLMIIAALGTAALFTACGDDSSSGASDDPMSGKSVVSCDMTTTIAGVSSHTCTAIAADNAAAEGLKTGCVSVEGMLAATAGTGCPSGAELACPNADGSSAEYFYDEGMGGFTCEQMAGPSEQTPAAQ